MFKILLRIYDEKKYLVLRAQRADFFCSNILMFMQVSLLKQRLQNGQISIELPEPNIQIQPEVQSPMKDIHTEKALQPGSLGRLETCAFISF